MSKPAKPVSAIIQAIIAGEDGSSVYQQQRTLFLITHMRSYSTLLSHILGSNPGIDGFIEAHRSYYDIRDIVALRKDVQYALNTPLGGGYIMDKVIHNKHSFSKQLIQREDISFMFMLRKPLDCINSLHQTSSRYGWNIDLDFSINYYIDRLKKIREFTFNSNQQPLYLDAESLVDNTTTTLEWLSSTLELQQPLSEEFNYQTFRGRGQMHSGDPSDYLRKGEVIKQRAPHTVELTPGKMELLEQTYHDTRATLLSNCTHMYQEAS